VANYLVTIQHKSSRSFKINRMTVYVQLIAFVRLGYIGQTRSKYVREKAIDAKSLRALPMTQLLRESNDYISTVEAFLSAPSSIEFAAGLLK
jgi:hypothetical protein